LELVIAGKPGDEGYAQDIHAAAAKDGMEEQVHLVGPVNEGEKSWYYHNCMALLLPSVAEGFGFPLVEALSVGKPVFAANRTALPEVGSDAAFYFDDFTVEHMQRRFTEGLFTFRHRNMAPQAKRQVERFCWKRAAGEYIRAYRDLVA
jgi:glycosyltransferase involved in cell wall biosynthesis